MAAPSEKEQDNEWVQEMIEKFCFDFDEADKDKSGTLSIDEVLKVLEKIGFYGTHEEAKAMFEHLDKNQDGQITREEFKKTVLKLPRMSVKEMVLRIAFQKLDMDKSGYLTKGELLVALKSNRTRVKPEIISDVLKYLKTEDEDEKVRYDEFLKVMHFEESAGIMFKIFEVLDKDKSGFLTLDEINAAIESETELRKIRPRLLQLAKDLAKDDDKKISYKEFVDSWLTNRPGVRAKQA